MLCYPQLEACVRFIRRQKSHGSSSINVWWCCRYIIALMFESMLENFATGGRTAISLWNWLSRRRVHGWTHRCFEGNIANVLDENIEGISYNRRWSSRQFPQHDLKLAQIFGGRSGHQLIPPFCILICLVLSNFDPRALVNHSTPPRTHF